MQPFLTALNFQQVSVNRYIVTIIICKFCCQKCKKKEDDYFLVTLIRTTKKSRNF